MQQRQRVDANNARGIVLDVAHADDGGEHVDVRPVAAEAIQRVGTREVALDTRDVRAGAQRSELGVVTPPREIVDERQLLAFVGEASAEMAADEAGAAENERASGAAHAYPIPAYRTPAARTAASSKIRQES